MPLVLDGDWPASVERLQSVLRRVRPTRDVLVFRHLSDDSLFVWATTLMVLLRRRRLLSLSLLVKAREKSFVISSGRIPQREKTS